MHEKKGSHRSLDAPCMVGNYLIDKLYCLVLNSGPRDWGSYITLTILPQPPSLNLINGGIYVCIFVWLHFAREMLVLSSSWQL